MKTTKHLTVFIAFLMIFTGLTGFNYLKTPGEKERQEWTSWSNRIFSECYKGISYRYRERKTSMSDKNEVQVEFKNGYSHGISISHRITTNPTDKCIYRFDLKSGGVSTKEQYVDKNKQMYVKLNKLRFDSDNYGDPYRGCDR